MIKSFMNLINFVILFCLCNVYGYAFAHGKIGNSTGLVQATWLPVSYESSSQESWYSMMSNLKDEGVNRVYVDVWNQGKVYFSSETMMNSVGETGIATDLLSWTLAAAEDLDMEVYAWFEYGLMPAYGSLNNDFAIYADSKGWILGQHSSFYWMDPVQLDALAFLAGIIKDCISGYSSRGLKGVQLDDHFGSPVELGRTQADMDAAMKYISDEVKSTGLNVDLSLSPSTLSFSISNYNVDWNRWGTLSYYNEVIPQLYRTTFDSFKSEFDYTLTHISRTTMHLWTAAGIRVDGSGESTPWVEVEAMLDYCSSYNMGSSVWYARGIIETYPTYFKEKWN